MKTTEPPIRYRERIKLALLGVLLLIMLGVLGFAATNTIQAAQNFQREYKAVKTKNVSAIHPWMTIRVISNIYQVPEDYLCQSLNLQNPKTYHRMTLYTIASRKKQPVTQVIRTLQHAILSYHKAHPTPMPTPKSGTKQSSPERGYT